MEIDVDIDTHRIRLTYSLKGTLVSNFAVLARRLSELLGLTDAPVAVSFDAPPGADAATPVPAQPAGCCFWGPAQQRRLDTVAADHANCSVGSYTHGLIPLEQAAAGADTAALVGSGWVGEADLMAAAALPFRPSSITYQPLADAENPDVVLARLSPTALMTLLGAVPDLIACPQAAMRDRSPCPRRPGRREPRLRGQPDPNPPPGRRDDVCDPGARTRIAHRAPGNLHGRGPSRQRIRGCGHGTQLQHGLTVIQLEKSRSHVAEKGR